MTITQLTVTNDMLGLLGELPVNDLGDYHPVVPRALSYIATTNATVQATRWWFNVEWPTLQPQADTKEILLPNDTLSVDSLTQYPQLAYRGGKLYNLDDSTYEFGDSVKVRLHRLLAFEDLPMLARVYIAASAKLRFAGSIDGADPLKVQLLRQEVAESYANFNAEHIRNNKGNFFNTPSVAYKLANIRGYRNTPRLR
jgi:hypothetical protein